MDSLDIKIFREFVQDRGTYSLQSDIRKSFRMVAKKLQVDEATVRSRIKKLHETGFIKEWSVFPNPNLFGQRLAHLRCDVRQPVLKDDAIRKIRLIQGVWVIVDHFGSSIRVILYFEDQQSLRKQIELITRISNSEDMVYSEIHFPQCNIKTTKEDWKIVRSIQRDPKKTYNAISKETGLSNKTVKRRLERMIKGRALFILPSLSPMSLSGAMLADLLVFYHSPESREEVDKNIESHFGEYLMSAISADPRLVVYLIVVTNISQVREILGWVKQQRGVESVYLDLIEERIELHETFNQQLRKKFT